MVKGTILLFDNAYLNYEMYRHWIKTGVGFVTRLHGQSVVQVLEDRLVSQAALEAGVLKDQWILLGRADQTEPVKLRLITFYDEDLKRTFEFITNLTQLGPVNIAQAYKQRWQIELLFKRLKQNLKFTDFLGDNENAINIRIWCALIADLLVTIKRKSFNFRIVPAYSNIVGLIRLHLMRYVDLKELLLCPDDPPLFGSPPTQQLALFNSGPP